MSAPETPFPRAHCGLQTWPSRTPTPNMRVCAHSHSRDFWLHTHTWSQSCQTLFKDCSHSCTLRSIHSVFHTCHYQACYLVWLLFWIWLSSVSCFRFFGFCPWNCCLYLAFRHWSLPEGFWVWITFSIGLPWSLSYFSTPTPYPTHYIQSGFLRVHYAIAC